MERIMILASHGKLAEGFHNALEIICGKQENVEVICAYLEEEFDLKKTVDNILIKHQGKEMIVLTDILGGSVNNEFFKHIQRDNYHLVTGTNLAIVIELATQLSSPGDMGQKITEIIENNITSARYFNEFIKDDESEEEF